MTDYSCGKLQHTYAKKGLKSMQKYTQDFIGLMVNFCLLFYTSIMVSHSASIKYKLIFNFQVSRQDFEIYH